MPLSISGDGTITGLSAGGLPNGSVTADDLASTLDLSGKTVTGLTNDSITEGNTTAEVVDTGSDGHFKVTTEGTERLRVDSSGNVNIDSSAFYFDAANNRFGVGTASPLTTLHTNTTSADNELRVATTTSGNPIVSFHANGAGAHEIGFDRSALALYFKTVGSSERMRIDSSGRLLVGGLTSPRTNIYKSNTNITPFNQIETVVNGYGNGLSLINYSASGYDPVLTLGLSKTNTQGENAIIAAGNDYGAINFVGNTGTDFRTGVYFQASCDSTPSSTSLPSRLSIGITPSGSLSPTERMRIANNGRTRVFSASGIDGFTSGTAQSAGTGVAVFLGAHSATSPTDGTTSFLVYSNGNVLNTNNSYGSLSDINLKENIVDAGSQWDDLKTIQVRKYNFKEETGHQTHTQLGVIAQEVELVSPGLVTESPDRDAEGNDLGTVTKSVNYSVLYMKAVKALQEAMERIETLESRVAQLEGGAA